MADEISIDDAQEHSKDLIAGLAPGAELVITEIVSADTQFDA